MEHVDRSTLRTVATGLRFPEGPVAVDDGSLLVVEIEGGTLTRIDPANGTTQPVADCGGGPNGAAFGPDGAIYVGNDGGLAFTTDGDLRYPHAIAEGNEGGSVQRFDPATGAVETVFTHSDGTRLGSLNDIVFDGSGSCYLADTTNGVLHYADPIARTIRVVESGIAFPNGAGLSPDGSHLYASETYTGQILRWNVQPGGDLRNRTLLYSAHGAHGCDGLAVDGAGNICASNLTGSGIVVIAADGAVRTRFSTPVPDPFVTNICFGGPDGRTAYICSSGRGTVYSVRWPWPGLRLHFAR
jgi:gluconolactonase